MCLVEAIIDRVAILTNPPGENVFVQTGEHPDEWGIKYIDGYSATVGHGDIRKGLITVRHLDGTTTEVPGHQIRPPLA